MQVVPWIDLTKENRRERNTNFFQLRITETLIKSYDFSFHRLPNERPKQTILQLWDALSFKALGFWETVKCSLLTLMRRSNRYNQKEKRNTVCEFCVGFLIFFSCCFLQVVPVANKDGICVFCDFSNITALDSCEWGISRKGYKGYFKANSHLDFNIFLGGKRK